MKTAKVLVLLLLASVHVFTPGSADESRENQNETDEKGTTEAKNTTGSADDSVGGEHETQTPEAKNKTGSADDSVGGEHETQTPEAKNKTGSADESVGGEHETQTPEAKNKTGSADESVLNESNGPEKKTPTPEAKNTTSSADESRENQNETDEKGTTEAKNTTGETEFTPLTTKPPHLVAMKPTDHETRMSMVPPNIPQTDNETLKNDPLHPRSSNTTTPGNDSESVVESPSGPGKNASSQDNQLPETSQPNEKTVDEKAPGSQTGGHEKEPPKSASNRRLWWILLPVVLVIAAATIILKFKCKKINDHTETIDTGTENASFQSRPESTKDGVMLLGVKSSGGEENAGVR